MVVENFVQGARPVYERGIAGSDERLQRCFQLMETDDPSLLDRWTAEWSDLVRFEIVPLIDSAEAAARALNSNAAS